MGSCKFPPYISMVLCIFTVRVLTCATVVYNTHHQPFAPTQTATGMGTDPERTKKKILELKRLESVRTMNF